MRTRAPWSAAVALLVAGTLVGCTAPEPLASSRPVSATPDGPTSVSIEGSLTAADLDVLSATRFFFAHRSVGASILEVGIPAVYESLGVSLGTGDQSPFIDYWLEQTDDPTAKIREFEATIRAMTATELPDVALLKIGYIDVWSGTDTARLFETYVRSMTGLETDFPGVVFLHSTVSVTGWNPEDNVAIERFNAAMRDRYAASGRLYDIATIVSTCMDGRTNVASTADGQTYYSICPEFTEDGGHLSLIGAERAATELLRIAAVAARSQ